MTDDFLPSPTALFSAAARAAHPLVDDEPHLLHDEIAQRLCEKLSPSPLDYHLAQPGAPILAAARFSAAVRSLYADQLVAASGIDQIVVVGGGLDTIASRLPAPHDERVWLVDRPGVLAWRSHLLASAGLDDPAQLVGADLTHGLDPQLLEASGVDLQRPIAFLWLGVSMYLPPASCERFFASVADVHPESSLIFDYVLPHELRDARGAEYSAAVAAMAGEAGEPWRCSAAPTTLHGWLASAGWHVHNDRDEEDGAPSGFWGRADHLKPMKLIRLVHASRRRA